MVFKVNKSEFNMANFQWYTRRVFAILFLMIVMMQCFSQSANNQEGMRIGSPYEVFFLAGFPIAGTPLMDTYVKPYRQRRFGYQLSAGLNRIFKTANANYEFGSSLGFNYRKFNYKADNIHSTAEDIWSYEGDFVECVGSLFVRTYSKNKVSSIALGLQPGIDFWGSYKEYMKHFTRFPTTPNSTLVNSRIEITQNRKYFLERMSFRVNIAYGNRIDDHLTFQFAILAGVSSRIASFDAYLGVVWRI